MVARRHVAVPTGRPDDRADDAALGFTVNHCGQHDMHDIQAMRCHRRRTRCV